MVSILPLDISPVAHAPEGRVRRVRILLVAIWIAVAASLSGAAPGPSLAQGISLYQAGRYDQALPYFVQAVRETPASSQAWIWLGATYLKLGRLPDATAALSKAVALDPQSGPAYLFLGVAYLRQGQRAQAEQALLRVRAQAPNTEYAAAAAQWLASLTSPQAPVPSMPAPPGGAPGQAGCPVPPQLPTLQPLPQARQRAAPVRLVDAAFSLEGEKLIVQGEIENMGEGPIRDVRLQLTAFGLAGKEIKQAAMRLREEVEAGELAAYAFSLGLEPPPVWVRIAVVDYAGRRGADQLDVLQAAVPDDLYMELARARVNLSISVSPPAPATRHLLCLWISDAAGLPVESVAARLTVSGANAAGATTEVKSVEVLINKATALPLAWARPLRPTVSAEIVAVRLTPQAGAR